jgi:hypothetical protein
LKLARFAFSFCFALGELVGGQVVERSNDLDDSGLEQSLDFRLWILVAFSLAMGEDEVEIVLSLLFMSKFVSDDQELCFCSRQALVVCLAPVSTIITAFSSPPTSSRSPRPSSPSSSGSSSSDDALECDNRALLEALVAYVDMLELLGRVKCRRFAAGWRDVNAGEGEEGAGAAENSPSPAAMSLLTPCTPSRIPSSIAPPCSWAAALVTGTEFEVDV